MGTVNDIRDFAERVEDLCNFLLANIDKDGSADVVTLQKLKEDAANIQFNTEDKFISIKGLSDHMRGILKSE